MKGPPSFLLQPKLFWLVVLSSNYFLYDFNATRFQNLKKNFGFFSFYWSLLKSYHIILILICPIGLEKTFNESWLKFLEKSLWFIWLRHFLLALLLIFCLLPVFVVVSIVTRLIVMSYWLTMHDKYPWTPNEAQLSVFFDFRSKLLNLMAVKTLKNIFREFFFNINRS